VTCLECNSTIQPGYRGACVTCLRREIDRLRTLLSQFGHISIPPNWPGDCKLRIDTRQDGTEYVSYHGRPESHLGILPSIAAWRAAREAAERSEG